MTRPAVTATRHLSRADWLKLLEPHLSKVSPATRVALLSGNTSFTDGSTRYTTDPVAPVTGPTHLIRGRVDSVTVGTNKDYIQ